MFIDGDQNARSGPGTSMFSRSGASTIARHKVFKSKFGSINELVAEAKVKKTAKRQNLAEQGEMGNVKSSKLPVTRLNEENQPIVEVPGLAEELYKLEKSYKKI